MKKEAATGIKVRIHHVPGNSYPKAKAASDQHPKLIVKKGKQVPPEEVVGATEIYKRLETLNEEIRSGAEVCFAMATLPIRPISLTTEVF